MVNPIGLTRDKGPFLNHLKCCTYFPFIPNFSLGAIEASKILTASDRAELLPQGFFPNSLEKQKIMNSDPLSFGQNEELLCPFYLNNQCSVWANRPGVCTSYFCKSNRGEQGLKEWHSIEKFLNFFESKLSEALLYKMNFNENVLSFSKAALELEAEPEEKDYFIKMAWGHWENKKIEFYQESRRLALRITQNELHEILQGKTLSDFILT